jgi:DMSO/TMAO reductase YedYZ molybdopterin-dependent catalytic subunit
MDAEPTAEGISMDELRLAARNHAMPLEALRYDLTPAGLHYVLIHYDIPAVDAAAFRLQVDGHVERPLSVSLDDLARRPDRVTRPITFECAGNGRALLEPRPLSQPWLTEAVGTAAWDGVPLRSILEEAGIRAGAVDVVFTGLDRGREKGVDQDYARALGVDDALADGPLLADRMNGEPLPVQHGFPLRLVVPGWYGMTQVKWLGRITVLDHAFEGFQNAVGYRFRRTEEETGEAVTRMEPRALMVPPGHPEFMTRARIVAAGPVEIEGRAWSGWGPVERVELSTDNGTTWTDATLDPPGAPDVWRRWTAVWDARPGEHVLCARATDATGRTQPLEPPWNLGGYANNAVQRVPVLVEG